MGLTEVFRIIRLGLWVLAGEDHRSKVPFSSHRAQGTCCQHDLPLMRLTLPPGTFVRFLCCDVVEGLSVFPSIIHLIICSIIVNHMIHGYLVYTLDCNPQLLKLFHPGSLRALFFGPCIPLTCPIILAFGFFLALSYFPALQDASVSSCVFPAPFLESAISPGSSGSFRWYWQPGSGYGMYWLLLGK